MTQPFNGAGDGLAAGPARPITAAADRPAGGTGPGVPLSIWPGLPAPGGTRDGLPCGGPVTAAAARRVIEAFSAPGNLVVAAACPPAVTEAAAAAGRRVLALAPAAAPDGQRPAGPAALPPPGDPAAGTAGLAIAGCHGPGCCGQQPPGPAGPDAGLLYAACERLLRPGGVLAVITGPATPGGPAADTAGNAVAAARAAGLVYAQHIVLVRAAVDGDRLVPAAGPEPGPGTEPPGGTPVHDDLLILTKPGGEARS